MPVVCRRCNRCNRMGTGHATDCRRFDALMSSRRTSGVSARGRAPTFWTESFLRFRSRVGNYSKSETRCIAEATQYTVLRRISRLATCEKRGMADGLLLPRAIDGGHKGAVNLGVLPLQILRKHFSLASLLSLFSRTILIAPVEIRNPHHNNAHLHPA